MERRLNYFFRVVDDYYLVNFAENLCVRTVDDTYHSIDRRLSQNFRHRVPSRK
jgi:hypothetical protein